MEKVLRRIWGIVEVVILIYVVLITILFLSKNKYGFTQIGKYTFINVDNTILKNSSGVKLGDLLVANNKKELSKGDTVYYYYVKNEKYTVRSDIVTDVESDRYVVNKSDVLDADRVIGKKSFSLMILGAFLNVSESKSGFLIFVFLPILIVFIYQVYEFIVFSNESKNINISNKKEDKNDKFKFVDDEII